MENKKYRLAQVRGIADDVDETRQIDFVISTEQRDRHGTVLRADRWQFDNYRNNPIVGYMHNVHGSMFGGDDPDDVIGKAEVFQDGTDTIGRVTFEPKEINEKAEKIFQKVKFGSLRGASVGFIETKEGEYGKGVEARGAENETYYFGGQELLEFSIVNIPSNPGAIRRSINEEYECQLDKVRSLYGDKLTDEDLHKMTLTGLVKLLTGEKENTDITKKSVDEAKEKTEELEKQKAEEERMRAIEEENQKLIDELKKEEEWTI